MEPLDEGGVPVLWNHGATPKLGGLSRAEVIVAVRKWTPGPIGHVVSVTTTPTLVTAGVRLDMNTGRGRKQWLAHRRGEQLAASISYEVLERDAEWIVKWRLIEVSLVAPGTQADPRAVTSSYRRR